MNSDRRRDRLRDIHRIAESLREDVVAPDLTEVIIKRVHEQRPFLCRSSRRLLIWCKVAAASLILVVAGMILAIRLSAPEVVQIAAPAPPAVLSPAVDSVRLTTVRAVEGLRGTSAKLERFWTEPLVAVTSTEPAETSGGITTIAFHATEPESAATADESYGVVMPPLPPEYLAYGDTLDLAFVGAARMNYVTLSGVPKPAGSPTSWQIDPRFADAYARSVVARRQAAAVQRRAASADDCPGCQLLDDFPLLITGQPGGGGLLPR
ncbi:MAG: hypothetical protein AB7G11_01420 [Phycisphaerales bacterium]